MRHFARLFLELDETTAANVQIALLRDYLGRVSPKDAAWCIGLIIGHRPRRSALAKQLAQWCIEATQIPPWLLEESRREVGDLGETIALLLPAATVPNEASLSDWIANRILPLVELGEQDRKEFVMACWQELDAPQRLVFNKLITGTLKMRIAEKLLATAIARLCGLSAEVIATRLREPWHASEGYFQSLIKKEVADADNCRPYPFCQFRSLTSEESLHRERGS